MIPDPGLAGDEIRVVLCSCEAIGLNRLFPCVPDLPAGPSAEVDPGGIGAGVFDVFAIVDMPTAADACIEAALDHSLPALNDRIGIGSTIRHLLQRLYPACGETVVSYYLQSLLSKRPRPVVYKSRVLLALSLLPRSAIPDSGVLLVLNRLGSSLHMTPWFPGPFFDNANGSR